MWSTRAVGLLLALLLSAYIHAEELPEDTSVEMLAAEQRADPPEPHEPGQKWPGLPKPYEVEIPEEEAQKKKRRGPRSGYMAGNPLLRHREPTKEELFKQVGLDLETGHASVVRARAGWTAPNPSLVPRTTPVLMSQTLRFAAAPPSAAWTRASSACATSPAVGAMLSDRFRVRLAEPTTLRRLCARDGRSSLRPTGTPTCPTSTSTWW